MLADFQRRCPEARAIFSSAVDVQGSLFRYAGVVESAAGAVAGSALDAGEYAEHGQIRVLLTLVGAAPPAQS
jgi:hypothetical protein